MGEEGGLIVQVSAEQETGSGTGSADFDGCLRRDAELIIDLQLGGIFVWSQKILDESGVFGIIEVLIDIEHGFLYPAAGAGFHGFWRVDFIKRRESNIAFGVIGHDSGQFTRCIKYFQVIQLQQEPATGGRAEDLVILVIETEFTSCEESVKAHWISQDTEWFADAGIFADVHADTGKHPGTALFLQAGHADAETFGMIAGDILCIIKQGAKFQETGAVSFTVTD